MIAITGTQNLESLYSNRISEFSDIFHKIKTKYNDISLLNDVKIY